MTDVDVMLALGDCPFAPLLDRVVIVPDPPEIVMMTGSGLVVPFGTAPTRGTVVAVGPGRYAASGRRIPMAVAPGDRVEYPKVGGTDVTYDDDLFHMIPEPLLLAIVTDG